MDMFARCADGRAGHGMGSAGVQAYFIANSSGEFGPFQYEEPLDLGGTRIVVRQRPGRDICHRRGGTGCSGAGHSGSATVVLWPRRSDAGLSNSISPDGRCDDLISSSTSCKSRRLTCLPNCNVRLPAPKGGAESSARCWPTHTSKTASRCPSQGRPSSKALMTDLAHLAKFKERLATYHPSSGWARKFRAAQLIASTQNKLKESTNKVQAIIGQKHPRRQTDRLVIPPKYLKLYQDELRARDMHKHEIVRLQGLLKQIGAELMARVSSPVVRQGGSAGLPRHGAESRGDGGIAAAMEDELRCAELAWAGEQPCNSIPVICRRDRGRVVPGRVSRLRARWRSDTPTKAGRRTIATPRRPARDRAARQPGRIIRSARGSNRRLPPDGGNAGRNGRGGR